MKKGVQWDERGWCRKTFNVRVKAQREDFRVAGPIEITAHDAPGYPMHWWLSIDRADYLIGQLQRAVKRATSASSSRARARKRAVRAGA